MPHVPVAAGLPGISGLMAAYPDIGKPMRALAQALLRGPSPLSEGDRELIATYVSTRNGCRFCSLSHGAAAAALLGISHGEVIQKMELPSALPPLLQSLFKIAEAVRSAVHPVSADLITAARSAGADDRMIHDTAAIAAAFSMFNRYVEGLDTFAPEGLDAYGPMGQRLAKYGYGG